MTNYSPFRQIRRSNFPMQTTKYLLEACRTEGLTHVFLVPGGLIDPFLPAF